MTSKYLHHSLREWDGAQELADRTDHKELVSTVKQILDLFESPDSVFVDSLPESLESAMDGPVGILSGVSEDGELIDLVVAARLVRHVGMAHGGQIPAELAALLLRLPD